MLNTSIFTHFVSIKKSKTSHKQVYKATLFTILIISLVSCSKKKDPLDLPQRISGTYYITYISVDGKSASYNNRVNYCTLTKVGSDKVDMNMVFPGSGNIPLAGIIVSDGGSGKVNLNVSDASGSLSGTVQQETLSFNLNTYSGSNMYLTAKK